MPSQKNIIQFSLSSDLLNKLQALSLERESLSLTAKRIVVEALGGELQFLSSTEDLKERLDALEKAFEQFVEATSDRFKQNSQSPAALNETIISESIDLPVEVDGLQELKNFLREVAGSNQHNRETGAGIIRSKKDTVLKLNYDNYPCPYTGEWNVPKLNKFCKEWGINL